MTATTWRRMEVTRMSTESWLRDRIVTQRRERIETIVVRALAAVLLAVAAWAVLPPEVFR